MSNRLDLLLMRMPSHFAKDRESNNYKLLSLIAQGSDETRTVYSTMLKFWDVDQSEGIGLDRLGKDEGISRGGWSDEEYRKMIKIQSILNLSDGDIDSINQILAAYMEKDFIGVQDGWMEYEPASLLVLIRSSATNVPFEILNRIKAAGVRIYVTVNELLEKIVLFGSTYAWDLKHKTTGKFKTISKHGAIGNEKITVIENIYDFPYRSRICGQFRAGGATS